MAPLRDMKGHSEQALAVLRKRIAKNFSYEMLSCLRFLDPTVDQMTEFDQAQREDMVQKVLKYATAMFQRRQEPADEVLVLREIGTFIGRPGVL